MTTWLITNPAAGRGEGDSRGDRLRELASQRGVRLCETRDEGDARRFAEQAVRQGVPTVVAAGGDGTVAEVINGMAADFQASRLAIVPLGTANDFATTLCLPAEVDRAMGLLEEGVEQRVDLMRASTDQTRPPRYIMNAATGGFSELVHEHLDEPMKQRWGVLAYLRAALEAVPEVCYHDARLEVDGETVEPRPCAVVVANGRSMGGMPIAPDADVRNSRLDVLIITAEQFFDRLRLTSKFALGEHLKDPNLIHRQARRLRIRTDPTMRFSSDGELIGQTPLTFEIVPGVLRVLSPMNGCAR